MSRQLWEVAEIKISAGPSRVTGPAELNEMVQYDRILCSVENGAGGMFMINGHGGTGKTFLYKVVCSKLRSDGAIVLCTASSGIAALLLPGGRTAHSMFKIPIDALSPVSMCCIPKNSMRADLIRAVKCIIWDEIVLQH